VLSVNGRLVGCTTRDYRRWCGALKDFPFVTACSVAYAGYDCKRT
jgi:hypothetical protein